jgi:hypothetical protein
MDQAKCVLSTPRITASKNTPPAGADQMILSDVRAFDGASEEAFAIPAINPTDDRRSDGGRDAVKASAIAPPARASRRGFLMNTMVSAASLSTATAAVALPTARAQPQEVSFPPGVVDRLVRIRERSFIQRQKDKAHRLAGTDPFYEDGDKVRDELLEEQCAAADAILSRSPQSIADLAWQAEAVLICDGPDMLESEKVYGLIQLFENVRALAGPLAIPSTVSFPEIVDPVFAVIERHKALSVAFDTAVGNVSPVPGNHPEYDHLSDISCQAGSELYEQTEKMFEFRPASLSGVATLLKYIASLKDWQMPNLFSEPIEGMQDLCRTMAAAIVPFSVVRCVASCSLADADVDPIFAAIEAHRSAADAHGKAAVAADIVALRKCGADLSRLDQLEAALDHAGELERDRVWDMIWTAPTTANGLAALLRYCRENESIDELVSNDEWEDVLEWTMESAACALAGLPAPPMGEVVAAAWESRTDDGSELETA